MKIVYGAALLAVLLGSAAQAAESARYSVQFDVAWTAKTHPLDYPDNAHFSGLIGATHNAGYTIFKDGGIASDGLEALSERGAHSPLDREINAAIAKGDAGMLFESAAQFQLPGKLTATFTATESHPYASVVAMIAPSPDWFTGVSMVPLRKDGTWAERIVMTLWAFDAGTDYGTTYKAADADAQPRQSVRLNAAPQFLGADGLKAVGTVTFTRQKAQIN